MAKRRWQAHSILLIFGLGLSSAPALSSPKAPSPPPGNADPGALQNELRSATRAAEDARGGVLETRAKIKATSSERRTADVAVQSQQREVKAHFQAGTAAYKKYSAAE